MSQYSAVAAKRYREYKRQKQKESFIHWMVTLVLRILHALIRTLQRANMKKARRVEKINVEREES
ncbi:MAG TPA: hypothetical protein VN239_05745 [Nitrososphaera sp.]|jgi:hypothetical protein|nr:hypothetical protein [Nitrososphaera sp.]